MTAQSKKIGDITVTTLSDGVLAAPLDVVLGMDKAESERLAGRKDNVPISVNAFLLERAGGGAHLDFPGFGYIVRNGAGFGFEPDA
jgi:hypothetical protein